MSGQSESRLPPSQRYLAALAERLAADGCEPRWEQWPGGPVLVGRRADFRIQWMATRLHLFTIAAAVPEISAAGIENFTRSAQEYAKARKGGLPPGLQTGIALFPCLVSEQVSPAALEWAQAQQRLQFAVIARPVVTDAARGVVGAFRGRPAMGWIYSSYLLGKLALYFDGALRVLERTNN